MTDPNYDAAREFVEGQRQVSHLAAEEKFYGDAVERFTAMANATCTKPINIYHFRMWCRIAADEIADLRAKLAKAAAPRVTTFDLIVKWIPSLTDDERRRLREMLG